MIEAGISKRSEIILLLDRGKSFSEVAKIMRVSRTMVHKWANRFFTERTEGLRRKRSNILKKYENDTIKEEVFAFLHSPPLDYGINRTSWKLDDLKKCLSEKGTFISKGYIRKIIKNAGYSWRKAKIILTSTDPDYREKLNKIQSILCNLENDECFFSIDEFGPVSIKMRGGRKLSAPGEYPSIPQYQKPKGYLIVTAALELSTNQVTHFYSKTKNTAEMIKLLDIIIMEYQTCRTIYLSWDAARWHASKAFFKHVDLITHSSLSSGHPTPIIKLAPLPKSAQFLNVIESVFSGMARAIIHNSDYSSVEECMIAIDSYFRERNLNFKKNPKKAGKKIWGNELVPAKFKEGQNCKNPRWR
jgi:transposase